MAPSVWHRKRGYQADEKPSSGTFRWIVSQRLVPKKDGSGRVAVIEILRTSQRVREYLEKGEREGRSLLDAISDGSNDGMQCFDDELENSSSQGRS